MTKKQYVAPLMEVEELETMDIVTTREIAVNAPIMTSAETANLMTTNRAWD